MRKISPPPGFDPRNFHPVASGYTDCATPAHCHVDVNLKKLSNALHKRKLLLVRVFNPFYSVHEIFLLGILILLVFIYFWLRSAVQVTSPALSEYLNVLAAFEQQELYVSQRNVPKEENFLK